MKLLLDTHVFLWFIADDPHLPANWRSAIRDPGHEVYLSVVSVWETMIKHQIGKLPLPQSPEQYLPTQRERHRIATLPVDEVSVCRLAQLPALHRDPFDRILIAQALEHQMTLITA
ncbi:MAG: type II toxin-antitoxin system VapC family toxin [Pirellulales bacterium]|nr:type II toxin-antitoxin system VapC family toxin [Pirellulales bacterium]